MECLASAINVLQRPLLECEMRDGTQSMAMALASPPSPAMRPLLPLSLIFLTSLLALFLLPCNGLSLSLLSLADHSTLFKSPNTITITIPNPQPNSLNGYPPPNSILGSLLPTARSRTFAARAAAFFHGHPCNPRFFMTWISPAEPMGPRELLAVESVFKSHPNACLLIVSDTMDSPLGAALLKPISHLGFRVSALSPDFTHLFKATPAARWFRRLRRGEVDPGEVPLGQNLSNLLRLAVLYKYGGVYIDADVIVMKSFKYFKNAIGAQTLDGRTGNWSRLNNAVMVFDKMHPLLYKFIAEFARAFDGNKWGHNGPYLVSRVVAKVVGRPEFEVTVLPPTAFYPVDWNKIQGLFQGPKSRDHSRWVSAKHRSITIRDRSFAVHLWNRQSRRVEVEEGSVIERIMLDCCLFCNSTGSARESRIDG